MPTTPPTDPKQPSSAANSPVNQTDSMGQLSAGQQPTTEQRAVDSDITPLVSDAFARTLLDDQAEVYGGIAARNDAAMRYLLQQGANLGSLPAVHSPLAELSTPSPYPRQSLQHVLESRDCFREFYVPATLGNNAQAMGAWAQSTAAQRNELLTQDNCFVYRNLLTSNPVMANYMLNCANPAQRQAMQRSASIDVVQATGAEKPALAAYNKDNFPLAHTHLRNLLRSGKFEEATYLWDSLKANQREQMMLQDDAAFYREAIRSPQDQVLATLLFASANDAQKIKMLGAAFAEAKLPTAQPEAVASYSRAGSARGADALYL